MKEISFVDCKSEPSSSRKSRSLYLRSGRVLIGVFIGLALCIATSSAPAHTSSTASAPAIDDKTPGAVDTNAVAPSGNSTACGKAGSHQTGVFNWNTTDGDKRKRTFMLQVPGNYNASKPYSLSFVFHGAGGSSAQSYSWGLQNASGASESSIFVFPDGISFEKYGIGWDDSSKGYDLGFFDNMVLDVEAHFCIDKAKVFVAGFSWGGDFATSLVCNRGNSIRAAAINSTTDEYNETSNFLSYAGMPCPTTIHPAVRFEHALKADSEYPAPYFSNTSKLMQHFNSCSSKSTKAVSSSVMACVAYDSCTVEYIECSFNDSIGHAIPPNWASDTWAFFSTFK